MKVFDAQAVNYIRWRVDVSHWWWEEGRKWGLSPCYYYSLYFSSSTASQFRTVKWIRAKLLFNFRGGMGLKIQIAGSIILIRLHHLSSPFSHPHPFSSLRRFVTFVLRKLIEFWTPIRNENTRAKWLTERNLTFLWYCNTGWGAKDQLKPGHRDYPFRPFSVTLNPKHGTRYNPIMPIKRPNTQP